MKGAIFVIGNFCGIEAYPGFVIGGILLFAL
jgi:hypothetical protein